MFEKDPFEGNKEITTFVPVPCGGHKSLLFYRLSGVKFIFSGLLGL